VNLTLESEKPNKRDYIIIGRVRKYTDVFEITISLTVIIDCGLW
jgi:hypothetical protein